MKRLFLLFFCAMSLLTAQAQKIQYNNIDSLNNVFLLSSDYLSFCSKGLKHAKSDERHSLSLSYYNNSSDSYFIISLPIVTPEKETVRKGSTLKLVLQSNDTITLKALKTVYSAEEFHENDSTYQVVLPDYPVAEADIQRIIAGKVTGFVQETIPAHETVRIWGANFTRWRFSKTLQDFYRAINKTKTEKVSSNLLYNNGTYEYLQKDSVVSSDKTIKFSEKWMY